MSQRKKSVAMTATKTRKGLSKERISSLKKEYAQMPEGSLHIKNSGNRYSFYHYINSSQICINSNTALVHKLARKKYLTYVIRYRDPTEFLEKCVDAGLNLQRVTLTRIQYHWVTSKYAKNTGWPEEKIYDTPSHVSMRSKSERDIGTRLEYCAVPYRYEMIIKVEVSSIIQGLGEYLAKRADWSYSPRSLFSYRDGHCHWNVPEELQWMNAPGSIWRSFDQRTQTVSMSVDFAILLRDGSILIWEHAGLCLNPVYRCNTSERIFILRESGQANEANLVYTIEKDITDLSEIDRIIEEKIIPRL